MKTWRIGAVGGLLVAGVVGAALLGPNQPGLAQDSDGTPTAIDPVDVGHPAFVYAGSCRALGDSVEPLSDLTVTQGDIVGAPAAIAVSRSFTTVPISLDELLGGEYTLDVRKSATEIDTRLACGDIGGILDTGDALTIGLHETDDSGRTGIAYLAAADEASTGILVFMTESDVTIGAAAATPAPGNSDTTGDDADTTPVASGPTPTPSLEERVEVSLTEWAITMPATIEAGDVIFRIINDGTVPHTFQISGNGQTESLPTSIGPGETAELELTLTPGTYEIVCTMGEGVHRDMGMITTLIVE